MINDARIFAADYGNVRRAGTDVDTNRAVGEIDAEIVVEPVEITGRSLALRPNVNFFVEVDIETAVIVNAF